MSPEITAKIILSSARRCVDSTPQFWQEAFGIRSDARHAAHLVAMLAIDSPSIKPDAESLDAQSQEIADLCDAIMVASDKIQTIRNAMYDAVSSLDKEYHNA